MLILIRFNSFHICSICFFAIKIIFLLSSIEIFSIKFKSIFLIIYNKKYYKILKNSELLTLTEFHKKTLINKGFDPKKIRTLYNPINILEIQEKVELFNETIYRLRLKGKHYFTELFRINEKPNILLDNGGLYLYLIINKPEYDKELLQVKKISRKIFLKQVSNILDKEIKHVCDTSNNKVKVYDYENTIINMQEISNKNKDQLRYIFYILEIICVLLFALNKIHLF